MRRPSAALRCRSTWMHRCVLSAFSTEIRLRVRACGRSLTRRSRSSSGGRACLQAPSGLQLRGSSRRPMPVQINFEAPHVPIGFGLPGFLMGSAVVPGWFRGGSAADLGWFRGGSGWFRVVPRPNWRLRSKAWAWGSATTNLWFLSCFPRILHAAPA